MNSCLLPSLRQFLGDKVSIHRTENAEEPIAVDLDRALAWGFDLPRCRSVAPSYC
jgi:hypothetical protein